MKFLCDNCKAKYQIGDDKVAGKAVRMKCRRCGHDIHVSANLLETASSSDLAGAVMIERSSPSLSMPPASIPAPALAPAPAVAPPAAAAPAAASAPAPAAPKYPGPVHASSDVNDEERTAIMAFPVRAPLPGRPSLNATGATAVGLGAPPSPAGPAGAPPAKPDAAPGTAGAAGLRPATGSLGPRAPTVSRPLGMTGTSGGSAARAPGAPRPAVAPRPSLTSMSGVAPRPPGAAAQGSSSVRAELRSMTDAGGAPAFSAKGPLSGNTSASAPAAPAAPADEWYVGISGVPLGPVPFAVVREKALAGLIDGESLVWRDGFDAWKPLKHFPELLELVTSAQALRAPTAAAASSAPADAPAPPPTRSDPSPAAGAPKGAGRASSGITASPLAAAPPLAPSPPAPVPPATPAEQSATRSPFPAVSRQSQPSSPTFGAPPVQELLSAAAAPPAALAPVGAPPLATPPPEPFTAPVPAAMFIAPTPPPSSPAEDLRSSPKLPIDVLADPFAVSASKPAAPAAPPPSALASSVVQPSAPAEAGLPAIALTKGTPDLDLDEPVRVKRSHGTPALAYAFIAMAAVFGGVAAWVLFSKPQQIIVVQSSPPPPPVASVAPSSTVAAPTAEPTAQVEVGELTTESTAAAPKPGPLASAAPRPKATATGAAAPIDTSGFFSTVPGPNANAPPPSQGGSGQLSAGEIQGVVAQNQPLVRRKCWQPALDARSTTGPTNARVTASIVIGPSGNVESASASGGEKDFPSLASCIAARVKGWKFPPSGGSTPANIPFVFAGQ